MDFYELGRGEGGGHRLDSSCSGQGQLSSTCDEGNEAAGSISCREFPDYLRKR